VRGTAYLRAARTFRLELHTFARDIGVWKLVGAHSVIVGDHDRDWIVVRRSKLDVDHL